jgi:phosphoglycerate kinase
MAMKLRQLPATTNLHGKRVLVRVDWNIPLTGRGTEEDSLKMERSFETIRNLSKRGAIVLLMTHLGRPKGRDPKLSTKKLTHIAAGLSGLTIQFLSEDISNASRREVAMKHIAAAKPGSIFLLENVRFLSGEEKNEAALATAFASLGDLFVNDAFASCHRAHVSVVGIAKKLPSYAGPALLAEVAGLERIITKPKKPFVAVVGGAKLSTKIEVLNALLSIADKVLVGGAMAHAFFAAKKLSIGKSYLEKESVAAAKKLLKNPKLVLPTDVVVANKIDAKVHPHVVLVKDIKKSDMIGDIGTDTMQAWANEISKAKTIVWNGPLGVTELPAFSHGSLVIGRMIAARSHGLTYGVVGGGDTLPVMIRSGMSEWIDHLSTGGGAMLEFIAKKGKLPGLMALEGAGVKPKASVRTAKKRK